MQSIEPPSTRSRYGLAAFMFAAGVAHFVIPKQYERIVPHVLGHEQLYVRVSGVAELAIGVLLAMPRTAKLGAWSAVVLLILVYPANIQMAIDTGMPAKPVDVLPWLRLPLQLPLIAWARRNAR